MQQALKVLQSGGKIFVGGVGRGREELTKNSMFLTGTPSAELDQSITEFLCKDPEAGNVIDLIFNQNLIPIPGSTTRTSIH